MTVFLAAVGVILTPIYLLSMLRQVFYGTGAELNCNLDDDKEQNQEDEESCFGTDCVLPSQAIYRDASWRELSIAASFIVLIVGIGLYPKLPMQMYDVKTVAVNAQVRQSYTQVAQTNPEIYANRILAFKRIAQVETAEVLGIIK